MSEQFNTSLFWAGLTVLVVVTAFALEYLLRALFDRYAELQRECPHRVSNQLPRVLHKADHDEVLVLESNRTRS